MWDKLIKGVAAAAGAVVSFFSGMPPLVWILLAVISLDYLTGIICACMGKSKKTEHGGLSSSTAFSGLLKKILILIGVMVAALVDRAVQLGAGVECAAVTGATGLWFIASEGMSIIENASLMGVKIPGILQKALEIMRDKGDPSPQPAAVPAAAPAADQDDEDDEDDQDDEDPPQDPGW